jgi:hypothetical protein
MQRSNAEEYGIRLSGNFFGIADSCQGIFWFHFVSYALHKLQNTFQQGTGQNFRVGDIEETCPGAYWSETQSQRCRKELELLRCMVWKCQSGSE